MRSELDDHEYPLIRIHAHGESLDEDITERMAFIRRNLDRGEPIALVFDTAGGKPLSARQRKMWTDWLADHDALLRRRLAGVGIVVTSALMRGVFTGVFWVWQPPIPYMFTGTVREADAWARERLAGAARAKR
jgi:hypothetical protein